MKYLIIIYYTLFGLSVHSQHTFNEMVDGLISKEGAIFIIANSLGVELNRSGFSNIWIPFTWSYDIANAVKNSIGNAKAYNKIINIGSPYMQSLEQLEKIITHCIYFQEGDGKLNEFNLTPKKVNYFDRGNRILGEYATTSLYEMVDNFISFNNIKEHSKFDS